MKKALRAHARPTGFTLTELLVVVAIIGVLAALIINSIPKAIKTAQLSTSMSNLKQLQTANINYSIDNGGSYVPMVAFNSAGTDVGWCWNDKFRPYVGVPPNPAPWPRKLLSPGATLKDASGNYRIERSYGMNSTGLATGAWFVPGSEFGTIMPRITDPSHTIAFADALSWKIDQSGLNVYRGKEEDFGGQAAIAYRYNGKAAVVFFDGHTEAMTVTQLSSNLDFWKYAK